MNMPETIAGFNPPAFAAIAVATGGLALAGTFAVRRIAQRVGWVARPRSDRWHTTPTALHGGIGFAPVFLVAAICLLLRSDRWPDELSVTSLAAQELLAPLAVVFGATVMFVTGLVDDLIDMRASTKLAMQAIAGAPLLAALGPFPLVGWAPIDVLITYAWLIGITNAVNLLDNMDGVSSGVCAVAFATITVTLGASFSGQEMPHAGWMAALMTAVTVGFWVHNRPPARVFMGDSGSLFLGFMLASLTLPSLLNRQWTSGSAPALSSLQQGIVACTIAGVPLLDTALVTVTRLWRSQSPAVGGKDHSTHRLARAGLSGWQTVTAVLVMSLASGLAAFGMVTERTIIYPLFGLYVVGLLLFGVWLSRVPVVQVDVRGRVQQFLRSRQEMLVPLAKAMIDAMLVSVCYYGAYLIRFDFRIDQDVTRAVVRSLPLVIASCIAVHAAFRSYSRSWRAISIHEVMDHVVPALVGAAVSVALIAVVVGLPPGFSRGAFVIFGLLLLIATVASRFSFLMLDETSARMRRRTGSKRAVIVYGAGRAGRLLQAEIDRADGLAEGFADGLNEVKVIGFADDDPHLQGRRIGGVPVMPPEAWASEPHTESLEIWVSSPKISPHRVDLLRAQMGCKPAARFLEVKISGLTTQPRVAD